MEQACNSNVIGLPSELLLQIFHAGEKDIMYKLAITHVCKIWRYLACATPSLWRTMLILFRRGTTESEFESAMSLLRLQLERSKGVMLDIVWYGKYSADENSRLLHLIRHEAPFHRWRSLTFAIQSFPCADSSTLAGPGAFSNLEILTIRGVSSGYTMIHNLLERTTTTKLQIVEFVESETIEVSFDSIRSRYSGILGRVRTVKLPYTEYNPRSPLHLPNNVLDLQSPYLRDHNWPHVQRYQLGIFFVDRSSTMDFSSLTNLVVDHDVYICHGGCVEFPRLIKCTVGGVWFRHESALSAPLLQSFQLARRGPPVNTGVPENWEEGLTSPGFNMIPSKRLELGITFRDEVLPGLVERCSPIEFLSINLGDREVLGQELVSRALGVEEGKINAQNYPKMPAPKLMELRLEFGWSLRDVDGWKAWATRLLRSRRDLRKNISIFASWKGEGVFVRLARYP